MTFRVSAAVLTAAVLLAAPAAALAGDWIANAKTGCKVWNPNPSAGETVNWSGACSGGLAEGKGVLDWLRGGTPFERDEGQWRAGRQTGEGTQTWPVGRYRGQFLDSLPHGSGVLIFGEAHYDGAFLNGRPNGKGVLTNGSGTFNAPGRTVALAMESGAPPPAFPCSLAPEIQREGRATILERKPP